MSSQMLDEQDLIRRLNAVTHDARVAFAASCCERMMPNLDAFVLIEGGIASKACNQALDAIWQWLLGDKLIIERLSNLKTQCEQGMFDPERYKSLWCGLATNAVSALMDAVDCCLTGSSQSAANTGVLADDTIYEFVSKVDKPLRESQVQTRGVGFDLWVMEHPLKIEELQKQQADLEMLQSQLLSAETVQQLRRAASQFGVQPFQRGIVKRG